MVIVTGAFQPLNPWEGDLKKQCLALGETDLLNPK